MSDKPGGTPSTEGEAVFGFEDLQGLREEYEERIRVMKEQHEAQLKNDGASRQELITDLTYELAAAREEGEMRARAAEAKRMSLEGELRTALEAIDRIELEVQRVKLALADALSPTDTNVAANVGQAPAPVSAVAPSVPPSSAPPVAATTRPAEMTTSAAHWNSGAVPVAPRPTESSGPITAPMGVPAPSSPPANVPSNVPSNVPAEVPVQASDVVATAAAPTPPPVPADPTPASTAAGARRKKIRLR